MKRRPDPRRCPQCREHVTPFAAGCAICGADLDPRRWDTGPSVGQRAGSWVGALRFGPSAGRPRSSSHPFLDAVRAYVVLGIGLSVVASASLVLLRLLGA